MVPLDELERLEKRVEFMARTFEQLDNHRGAAYERSRTQAEIMRRRHSFDPDSPEYFFEVGDWVKLKRFGMTKFQFDWVGPYPVADAGTYWLMAPDGRRLV